MKFLGLTREKKLYRVLCILQMKGGSSRQVEVFTRATTRNGARRRAEKEMTFKAIRARQVKTKTK